MEEVVEAPSMGVFKTWPGTEQEVGGEISPGPFHPERLCNAATSDSTTSSWSPSPSTFKRYLSQGEDKCWLWAYHGRREEANPLQSKAQPSEAKACPGWAASAPAGNTVIYPGGFLCCARSSLPHNMENGPGDGSPLPYGDAPWSPPPPFGPWRCCRGATSQWNLL